MNFVMERISQCNKNLEVWNKELFGSMRKHIQQARNHIHKLQQADSRGLRIKDNNQLRIELQQWLEK